MIKWVLFFLLIFFNYSIHAQSDSCVGRPEERFRILFLLDASHSMEMKWGKETLWDVAKTTIEDFAYFLQKNYNVEMGLRVYGHNSPVSENDCEDSRLEVPIEENSAFKIANKLKTIKYKGTTPLTYSLEKAAEDLGCNSKKNMIILITDGYETCNRNPCAIAEKLLDYRIAIKPLIVGLNIDPKEIQHLNCIGEFKNAKDKTSFKKELYNSFTTIANRRQFSVFLKNGPNQLSETNIPFTIYNPKNKEVIASYHHHLAKNNLPDTLIIGNYDSVDIKVHSTPPIFLENLKLKKYIHNTIQIEYPRSTLNVFWESPLIKAYDKPLVLVYNKSTLTDKMTIPSIIDLNAGTYSLAINTIPSIFYSSLELTKAKTFEIKLPTPGNLIISYSGQIYADLYYYNKNKLEKCYNLYSAKNIDYLTLLPGKYKIIYRSQKSMTIHASFEKTFDIISNGQVNISL